LQQTEMVDDNDGVRVSPHRLGAVIQAPPAQEIHRQAMSPGRGRSVASWYRGGTGRCQH
jgi:hypothetical protein